MIRRRPWPGRPYPLGATVTDEGVNFALFSENATGVDLCLFDRKKPNQEERVRLTEHTDQVWHAFLPGLGHGQHYGYRVYGAYAPRKGQRFNPSKVSLDPYAKAITGDVQWSDEMFPYVLGGPREDLQRDYRSNTGGIPKSVVVDASFDWERDAKLDIPLHESIVYELHVKGFTRLLKKIPEQLRGTYAGLASDEAIDYLKKLGVTAVELMPVHHFVHDKVLVDRGLTNYWGYNSIGYFAPHAAYSGAGGDGQQVLEFKTMVKKLHSAGLEVILDVVYNHTAEGNHLGPSLSFRGIDNASYYRLVADDPRYYMDYTGCGNTLNAMHPRVLQLIMDSLRYWVTEMRVDGFRFDLAPALARELHDVDKLGAFFDIIHQDPVISQVKLIAEPWDIGEGGYQVGNFPVLWAEWNGRYRDTVRSYWKGDEGKIGDFAYRLTGSPDLYEFSGRRPYASINFITAHDGFTLADLVSYNEKHNEANKEENRDGDDNNHSWNCGEEGPTSDPEVLALRRRQRRNFLTTLFLSQGVPMLCAGDEYGRTQQGNNNTYCQDNELSWFNWDWDDQSGQFHAFTRRLIEFRKTHPVFRRPRFFQGRRIRGTDIKDVMWFNPSGEEMRDEEWQTHFASCLGMLLSGQAKDVFNKRGEPVHDDTFLLLFNSHYEDLPFTLPTSENVWHLLLDTRLETGFLEERESYNAGEDLELGSRSVCLLQIDSVNESEGGKH